MNWLPDFILATQPKSWALAFGVFAGVFAATWLGGRLARVYFTRLAKNTHTLADDVVAAAFAKTGWLFPLALGILVAARFIQLPDSARGPLRNVVVIVFLFQVGRWATAGLTRWLDLLQTKHADEGETLTWLHGISWVGRLAIWSTVLLLALDNIGVDVTGLATGMGIGGIAVALAVQNILGDLFASFSIYIDKPFVIGDLLTVGSLTGTVEEIGLKTTRLRSASGEMLVFSNGDLLKSRILNAGRMEQRRVVFSIGVTYDTPAATIRRIPGMIEETLAAEGQVRLTRCHFKEFADSSLIIETVYWVLVRDFEVHMDIQQRVNLSILDRFGEEGIEFAFPTRTLMLEQELPSGMPERSETNPEKE